MVFNTNFAFPRRGGESLNDRRGRAAGETNSRLGWTMHPGVHRAYPHPALKRDHTGWNCSQRWRISRCKITGQRVTEINTESRHVFSLLSLSFLLQTAEPTEINWNTPLPVIWDYAKRSFFSTMHLGFVKLFLREMEEVVWLTTCFKEVRREVARLENFTKKSRIP